jgi:flagellar hook-associated protein 2
VVSDAIPDVTLNLKAKTAPDKPVTVTVDRDVSSVKTNIKDLVTAYNDIVKFINERSTYDITTKTGGDFFNEGSAKSIVGRLRSALSAEVGTASNYTSVAQIGFKTERDGTITVDEAKLDAALNDNYAAVKSLFISQPSVTGVAQRLNDMVDVLDDVENGSVSTRKQSLQAQITKMSDDIANKQTALSQYEERLRAQYAALDALLSQLKGQTASLQSLQTSQ